MRRTFWELLTSSAIELIKSAEGSKRLAMTPDILIMDEPTRGIDVGAKSEIYALMRKLTQAGKSIIMISSEMVEIMKVSDRVIVMHEGSITRELLSEEVTKNNIMHAAFGGVKNVR